jgi:hypothetical protein
VVRYDGIPAAIGDPQLGQSGFLHTDDGALVVGEPDVAATWFPVNDHPTDKASYTFKITAPSELQVVANGKLEKQRKRHGWTTWTWDAKEPMASYLAMMAIGEFDVTAYREDGIKFWDAIDPDLFARPVTGDGFAMSQAADRTYKRLGRTITVPDGGAQMSFWINRDTEEAWDFAFVEAHTVGLDDWTTLQDLNGNNSQDTGFSCPFGNWQQFHPFLAHYQTVIDTPDGPACTPTGSSGVWWAATGTSVGYEQWLVDLSAFAGSDVEVSISYASDEVVQWPGVFVDDVVVSTGEGSTSFENDGDALDGWSPLGAPEGSQANANDWIAGTPEDGTGSRGDIAAGSLSREPEILDFLADNFGPYPFSTSGGVVDDLVGLGFALENQTRPVYAKDFFTDPLSGDNVVVHELAHQWFGDDVAVEAWQHIWLNEGFATYAEWLWSEHEGLGTAQDNFDFWYGVFDETSPFWAVPIGDPGPDSIFDFAVYKRGGMTLHQLRLLVGDDDFFTILRQWASSQAGGNGTTDEFIALAEQVSGQQLDEFFQTWLFTPERPVIATPLAARTASATTDVRHAPAGAGSVRIRSGGSLKVI